MRFYRLLSTPEGAEGVDGVAPELAPLPRARSFWSLCASRRRRSFRASLLRWASARSAASALASDSALGLGLGLTVGSLSAAHAAAATVPTMTNKRSFRIYSS